MGARLTLLLPRLGFGALVAGALLVPIASTSALADASVLPKAVVSWVTVLIAVLGVVVESWSWRRWPVGRLRILAPLGVLVGWTALATVASPQPLVSFVGGYGRYDGLVGLLTGAGAALALVAYTARAPERLARIPVAVLAGGAIGLAVVVVQALGWPGTGWAAPWSEADGIIGLAGNPNFSGALLALAVPFALGLRAHTTGRGPRAALAVAAVALAGGVVVTGTRGGLLALAAGVTAFAWLVPDLVSKVIRWGASAALVVALGAVAASSVSDVLPVGGPDGLPGVLDTGGLGQRENIWAGSARIVGANPVVGVGPDALALEFPYERSSRTQGRGLIDADEAHDVYLDRAATAGLPALASYVWLIGTVAVVAWRGRRRVAAEHRWMLGAFGGAFAGYLLQGAVSIDVVPLAFVSWLAIGGLVSLTDPAAAPAAPAEGEARPVPAALLAVLLGAALVGSAVAVRPVIADRHARIGMTDAAAGRSLQAYGQFAQASGWLGHEPSYHQQQATALVAEAGAPATDPELRRMLLDEALIAVDHALDRAPGRVPILLTQADVHLLAAEAAPSTEEADAHVAAALATLRRLDREVRADDALHLRLGRALEVRSRLGSGAAAARDRAAAERHFEQARGYVPDSLPALEGLARIALEEGRLRDAQRHLAEARRLAPDDEDLDAAADEVDRRIRDGG
jgi:O-antigen ligase